MLALGSELSLFWMMTGLDEAGTASNISIFLYNV
jgi:hypothetical protein